MKNSGAGRLLSQPKRKFAPPTLSAKGHEAKFGGALLDGLVGHGEERRGHGDAQRLRGLEVDGEREFGRLHDWQVTGILTLEDAADIDAHLAVTVHWIGAVADESAGFDRLAQ